MPSVRPPFFFRWLSPRFLYCDIPVKDKTLFLTFDDGPVPEATPEILEILERYQARATFFMVGDNVRKHPEVYEMVRQAGHAIGNHTFHHLNGWQTPPGAYIEDVNRCTAHFQTNLFRPPYGRFSVSQYFLLGSQYRFILWSVLSCDFDRNTTPEQCLNNVIRYGTAGSVIVFHDSLKALENVRYALPRVLDHFTAEGFGFEKIVF